MRVTRTKKRVVRTLFYRLVSILLVITTVVFFANLIKADLLPLKHFVILLVIALVFNFINISAFRMERLKIKVKNFMSIFCIVIIIAMGISNFYIKKTLTVLDNNQNLGYKVENYSLIVYKNGNYKTAFDVKDRTVGFYKNSIGLDAENNELLNDVKVNLKSYNSLENLINDYLEGNIDAILIGDSMRPIIDEENEDFSNISKTIYSFKVTIETQSTAKDAYVTKDPFAVYISGIDTYGEISSVSRSDVNIVMVVNPTTHQALLISIPRDYYVKLHGTEGPKDKLTHAGVYGIDMSVKTLEDLLQTRINYYIKVNFTSIIDLVNLLGGLDVYSEYSFISYSNFKFTKGMNYVNGEQALDFARTRKAFEDGDRQRGKNQQAIIEALIRKMTTKSIITKYSSILDSIDGKYETNMSTKKITSLIKMQLADMPSWSVTSYSLEGYDSMDYTYTYDQPLYVMKPDEDSVLEAIDLISKILNNEELENSYENIFENGYTSSKVYLAQ